MAWGLDIGFGITGIVELRGCDVTDERRSIKKKRERLKIDPEIGRASCRERV